MKKSSTREELAEAAGLPIENFHPSEAGLHMEILDTRTMEVWQTMANVTREEFDALEVADPYRKVGIGGLAAYSSYFRRSPDLDMSASRLGPMTRLEYAGYTWSQCANLMGAPEFPAGPKGPRLMKVNKHHSIVYAAGVDLRYLESPTGDCYVHVVDGGLGGDSLVLPEGWSRGCVTLGKETIVDLPCPTSAFFFANMESYQGPVSKPG